MFVVKYFLLVANCVELSFFCTKKVIFGTKNLFVQKNFIIVQKKTDWNKQNILVPTNFSVV